MTATRKLPIEKLELLLHFAIQLTNCVWPLHLYLVSSDADMEWIEQRSVHCEVQVKRDRRRAHRISMERDITASLRTQMAKSNEKGTGKKIQLLLTTILLLLLHSAVVKATFSGEYIAQNQNGICKSPDFPGLVCVSKLAKQKYCLQNNYNLRKVLFLLFKTAIRHLNENQIRVGFLLCWIWLQQYADVKRPQWMFQSWQWNPSITGFITCINYVNNEHK